MKLALMQSAPVEGLEDGYDRLAEASAQAAGEGASLLVTPEMFLTGYNIPVPDIHDASIRVDVLRLQELAREIGIGLLIGLPRHEGKYTYNTILFIDQAGEVRAQYRKTHLFGDLDNDRFSPGPALSEVFEWDGWRIGLAICYDIEFPEVARTLALQGAELILVPTANMDPYHSVCTRLVPARAEENAVYLAYVNQAGPEGDITYCGLSCLCGPDGEDVARAGREPGLLFAELDQDRVRKARQSQTHLRDRRADLY